MSTPLFSVIVPVYNVEKYLQQCVDSILNQSFVNFEVILVDDGSPDNCPQICDNYAQKDPRVRVIHKNNGGLCAARNTGLEIAKGKYIVFCDSDDHLKPMYLERFKSLLDNENVALAICGFSSVDENGCTIDGRESINNSKLQGIHKLNFDIFWLLFENRRIGSCWDKAYINEIIQKEKLTFDEKVTCVEDTDFVLRYIDAMGKDWHIAVTDEKLYNYLTTSHGSLVQRIYKERWQMFELVLSRLEKNITSDKHKTAFLKYLYSAICFTIDRIFGNKPEISYCEFKQLMGGMCRSGIYKKYRIAVKYSQPRTIYKKIVCSGSPVLIWGYHRVWLIKQKIQGH